MLPPAARSTRPRPPPRSSTSESPSRGGAVRSRARRGCRRPGHHHVEHADVGPLLDGPLDGAATVGRLGAHLEAGALERRPDPEERDRAVVSDQHAHGAGWSLHRGRRYSNGPGGAGTIALMPGVPCRAPAAPVRSATRVIRREGSDPVVARRTEETAAPHQPAGAAPAFDLASEHPLRVLVAEDSHVNQIVVRALSSVSAITRTSSETVRRRSRPCCVSPTTSC